MELVTKTGGSTTRGMYPSGLFEHQGGLYVARTKWHQPLYRGGIKTIRCEDGERVYIDAAASIYPMEHRP